MGASDSPKKVIFMYFWPKVSIIYMPGAPGFVQVPSFVSGVLTTPASPSRGLRMSCSFGGYPCTWHCPIAFKEPRPRLRGGGLRMGHYRPRPWGSKYVNTSDLEAKTYVGHLDPHPKGPKYLTIGYLGILY